MCSLKESLLIIELQATIEMTVPDGRVFSVLLVR